MKSLQLACIFALVLVIIIGLCSGSADVKAAVADGEGVVISDIYVDESLHVIPNKNCTETDNRLKISDIPDQVVVTHEDDHSNCREGACQVNKRGGGSHSKVNPPIRPEGNSPVIPFDSDCAKLFPNSPGIRCQVFIDRVPTGVVGGGSQTLSLGNTVHTNVGGRLGVVGSGSQTITHGNGGRAVNGFHNTGLPGISNGGFQSFSQTKGGSPIIHVIGGGSSNIPATSPGRGVINLVQNPRIPERHSVNLGSFNVPRRTVKYLQIVGDRDGRTGGRTYTYRVKGIRHPRRYFSGETVSGRVRSRSGFPSRNRGALSIGSGNRYRSTSGESITVLEEDQFAGSPFRDGDIVEISSGEEGYTDVSYSDYPGDESTIDLNETGDNGWRSHGYGDVEVLDEGFNNDEQIIEAGLGGYGGQVYVSGGYYADGHSSGPHYDSINEYNYHHS